jgi:hypothetical protein
MKVPDGSRPEHVDGNRMSDDYLQGINNQLREINQRQRRDQQRAQYGYSTGDAIVALIVMGLQEAAPDGSARAPDRHRRLRRLVRLPRDDRWLDTQEVDDQG